MILGVGLDVVNIGRFREHLTDLLRDRLFAESERGRGARDLAGAFAVKEAVVKAFGGVDGFSWRDVVVRHDESGAPRVILEGPVRRLAEERGVERIHVSISHDDPVAAATVILEGRSSE